MPCRYATTLRSIRGMTNLLKIAVTAAGGTKRVAKELGIHPANVSRYINGSIPFPPDRVSWLCAEGGYIISAKRMAEWLANREAEKARAKVLARAA